MRYIPFFCLFITSHLPMELYLSRKITEISNNFIYILFIHLFLFYLTCIGLYRIFSHLLSIKPFKWNNCCRLISYIIFCRTCKQKYKRIQPYTVNDSMYYVGGQQVKLSTKCMFLGLLVAELR